MPANTAPLFALTPNIGQALVLLANTNSDGTGNLTSSVTMYIAFTGAANGSWVSKARINVTASTAGSTSSASVLRFYYSTVGTGATTSANTKLIQEVAVPAVTADSATVPTNPIEVPLNIAIPTGGFIHVSSHATPGSNCSFEVLAFGGDY